MRIVKYIALFLCSFLWLLGCSNDLSKYLFAHHLVKDDYRYGDLYRMSNLKQFKALKEDCNTLKVQATPHTHLYLAGDSFTEEGRIEGNQFAASDFTRFRVDQVSAFPMDKSQHNILVIETVERHFRERFAEPWKGLRLVDEENKDQIPEADSRSLWTKVWDFSLPYNEELHQSILFGYDWTMKVREWKAALNYTLFDRVDEHVKLSKNQAHLLYYLPSEPGISSAFEVIDNEEISNLVRNVNATYSYYKNLGFDEVYLAIIPNKTSILGQDLGEYNRLAERIERAPDIKMPVIDAYQEFMKLGEKAYALGDTHWSCEGQTYWVNAVNNRVLRDFMN
ncbi:hypothetical protein LAG90_05540 [Marinilongibacter aquaticus]|uniref:hypothetical protein n=1 Tax=Marinilongibacter aquaticus TaxID=2975157 RepID=UPI0021BDCAF7|nr:hypothetical protein [Marinilongibacter aquaticus]UBM60103.1 hypothetical protein LAG90_05540 [Marinilongibacter aquaticus]